MAEASLLLPALISGGTALAASAMAPKPPKPQPPAIMPDEKSPAVLEARRRKIAERQATSGRDSTILSDDSYANNLLGE